ncbi:MAG: 4-(cytidine 5'-diphospho)-2-C-methyl-D-erythritol kinase [Acidobacteria bacterium]|nr:4-(cytidine 5'-diphospho)-2-C-methyl-D-erythritol kinase [Acidobacteriota bacterium]MCI0719686.1 4-(cytidine 5'-diphospho)-2-C-methyl-D-erythritol kinase [Acidobacteriota bacterium]
MPVKFHQIVLRSYAKINLGLHILGKRPDGYHEVRTVLHTVALHDRLTLQRARTTGIRFRSNVPEIDSLDNLVVRAIKVFQRETGIPGGVSVSLEKAIPLRAGLGGGSSNAATTLLGLVKLFGLDCSNSDLMNWAGPLGSDVPFFLVGGRALGIGRGSEVYPLEELPKRHVLLAIPASGVSTADAYARLSLQLTNTHRESMIPRFCSGCWTSLAQQNAPENNFEAGFFEDFPHLRKVKSGWLASGAVTAGLTGSGSALFGVFARKREMESAASMVAGLDLRLIQTRTLRRTEYHSEIVESLQ